MRNDAFADAYARRVSTEGLLAIVKAAISRHNAKFSPKYGPLSLDAPRGCTGQTLLERLSDAGHDDD